MLRRAGRLLAASLALLVATSALTAITAENQPANAISGSTFDPGYIISDSVFYDFGTMTVEDIQRFLNSKVTNCTAKGSPTCLKSYVTDIPDVAADPGKCASVVAAPKQSAARVIFTVANACGINPRVLLVMLQKEQGLISSTNPTTYMYKAALGYGCPDSNPAICGKVFSGLFNQLYKAAGQLRWYGNPKGSYTYLKPGKTISRPLSPNSYATLDKKGNVVKAATCGFKSFVLQNQATANLYYYTPYTPNDAALKNLYSLGDSCSAYGNRNFWRYYWDWFGSPIGGGFLLKSATSEVFLIVNDTRYRVGDPSLLASLAPLGPLGTISQAYLESFKLGRDLTRVFSSATGQYFFVDESKRFSFSDCNQVTSLGLDCTKAVQLTSSQISALAPGGSVTAYVQGTESDSYLIQNGVRREILDPESVADAKITLPALSKISAASFDFLPWGAPIAKDGSMFVNRSTQNIGIVVGGSYFEIDQSVSSIADFAKWFRSSSGNLSSEGVSNISTNTLVTDIVEGPGKETYIISSAGKRPITNPNEFFSEGVAVPVSQAFLNRLAVDSQPLTAPLVARASNSKTYYLIRNGERRMVESVAAKAAILEQIENKTVAVIPEVALNQIEVGQPQIAPASFIEIQGKADTYLIDGLDSRVKVASTKIAKQFGLSTPKSYVKAAVAAFSLTGTITGPKVQCGETVFVAADGELHAINAGWAGHYPGTQISLDASTCSSLRRATSPFGRFIVTPDAKYWLVLDNQKRLLTGKSQYQALRGNGPAALKVSLAFSELLVTGKPIRKTTKTPINLPEVNVPTPTPNPTPTATPTPKPTPTPTPTPKPTPKPTPTATPTPQTYRVVSGDSLNAIAIKFSPKGATRSEILAKVSAIAKANKIANINNIQVGQLLLIP